MFGFIVLTLITIGGPVAVDQYHKGNLPDAPPACETKLVKAATGNYYYQEVDTQGDCVYIRKEF